VTSAIVTLNRQWLDHVLDCSACEQWWLTEGKGVRCVDGWALSETFEQRLEEGMPVPVVSTLLVDDDLVEEVDRPFCPNHGALKAEELRGEPDAEECVHCGQLVSWRAPA
jgi:hypothetical protein